MIALWIIGGLVLLLFLLSLVAREGCSGVRRRDIPFAPARWLVSI